MFSEYIEAALRRAKYETLGNGTYMATVDGLQGVIATGETHSVREFLDEAFGYAEMDWKRYVEIDPHYFRPVEVDVLMGDASKAKRQLGWQSKVRFRELVRIMVDADMKSVSEATGVSAARSVRI